MSTLVSKGGHHSAPSQQDQDGARPRDLQDQLCLRSIDNSSVVIRLAPELLGIGKRDKSWPMLRLME
jgi:hypothetical protein